MNKKDKYKRELHGCATRVQSIELGVLDTTAQLKQWLEVQAVAFGGTHLLAHAEDGVNWGRFDVADGKVTLITGFEAEEVAKEKLRYSAELNPRTLWQVRLFGNDAEVMLWREQGVPNATWQARAICDQANTDVLFERYFDEDQLLLGSEGTPVGKTGFTRMREGSAELVHVLPVAVQAANRQHRARLVMRYYLAKGETLARVVTTRVVKLRSGRGNA